MHKKGQASIPPNYMVGIIIIIVLLGLFFLLKSDLSPIQENQNKIISELESTDSIINALNSQKHTLTLLNQDIALLEKNKASEESVKVLQSDVRALNRNIENNNRILESIGNQMQSIEETITIIEPSHVQNIDVINFRTLINILNFRLAINFFIALTVFELIKVFGDFLSFGNYTKIWNIKTYFEFRRRNKNHQLNQKIIVCQQSNDSKTK